MINKRYGHIRLKLRAGILSFLLSCAVLGEHSRTLFVYPDGDDTTARPDDPTRPYQTLTNAFHALQNGDRLEIATGRYQVFPGFPTSYFPMPDYAQLRLENLTNVALLGIGKVEIYGEGPGDFLMIQNCSDIRVQGITFKGNRPNVPEDVPEPLLFSTVQLRGRNNRLHFEDCRFIDFGNHAISHLWGPKRSYNMVVTNCYFSDGGDGEGVPYLDEDGAAISGISSGSIIVNNRIERCFRGIEVEGAFDEYITNVVIQGNVITNCYSVGIMLFATNPWGLNRPEAYSDIRIINNRINSFITPPGYEPKLQFGVFLSGGTNLQVIGNFVDNAPHGIGIWVTSQFMEILNPQVISNEVHNVLGRGIQVFQLGNRLENAVIKANHVFNAGDEGILMNGRYFECSGNLVQDSARNGVRAAISFSGSHALIADNAITHQSPNYAHYGIWLSSGSSNCVLYGNTFQSPRVSAIRDDAANTGMFPKIKSAQKIDSSIHFEISGNPGRDYSLEVSQNLDHWETVATSSCPQTGWFEVQYSLPTAQATSLGTFFRVLSGQ